MHPLLAFAFRGRHGILRMFLLAVLMSVPIVTFTSSDYLTLSKLNEIEDDMVLALQVSHSQLNSFLEALESIRTNSDLRNVTAMSIAVLPETWLVNDGITLGPGVTLIGIENWSGSEDDVAVDPQTAKRLALEVSVNLTDSHNAFTQSYSLTPLPPLTDLQLSIIRELEQIAAAEGMTSHARLFGSLQFTYNESLEILPKLGLSPFSAERFVVSAFLKRGITVGTFKSISNKVNLLVEHAIRSLSKAGNVNILRDPRTNLESVRLVYEQLEWSLLTITLPGIGGCIVFLFVASWTHFEAISTERQRLTVRGISKNQFMAVNLLEAATIGALGGVLSIPAGAILSMIAFDLTSPDWEGWFNILFQNSSATIGVPLLGSIVLSMAAVYAALTPSEKHSIDSKVISGLLGMLVLILVFADIILGFPSLFLIQRIGSWFNSLIAGVIVTLFVLMELLLFILTPVLAPIFVSRAYPKWSGLFRKSVTKLLKLEILIAKSLATKPTRRLRFVFLTMIITFVLSAPVIAFSAHEAMRTTDQQLVTGADLRVTVHGLNATFCSTNLTTKLSSIEGVTTTAWTSILEVNAGFAQPLLKRSSLFVVTDEYFQLPLVKKYFDNIPAFALLSSSLAKETESPAEVLIETESSIRSVPVSGTFYFLPGFHQTTFQFQEGDLAVLLTLSTFENQFGIFNSTFSTLLVEVSDARSLNDIVSQVNVVLNETLGDESKFVISYSSSDEILNVEYRIALAAESFLFLAGILALAFVISLDVRDLKSDAITLISRGTSRSQLILGVLVEEVAILVPTIFFGIVTSISYYYGLSLSTLLLFVPSITELPIGYIMPFPIALLLILLAMFLTLTVVTFIETMRWRMVQYRRVIDVIPSCFE